MAQSRPVREIVDDISDDVKLLVRSEIELAKAELIPSAKNAGKGAGMFSGAGYFALNAMILFFIAGALGIAQLGINIALSFVIMGGILLLLAAILGLIGLAIVKKIKGPKRTIEQATTTIESVKGAIQRGKAMATAPRIESNVIDDHKLIDNHKELL